MSKWRRLVDVLQENEEMYRKFVDYTPINDVESVTLMADKTGWKRDQTLIAEDLQWHPVLIDGKPCLINHETETGLLLQGEKGYLNRHEMFAKYCKLYSDEDWNTSVIPLDEETYEGLPEYIKSKLGTCWLDDGFDRSNLVGAKSTWCNKVHESFLRYNGEDNYYGFHMCMIIQLPENILVYMDNSVWDGSCYEKALKISNSECQIDCGEEPKTPEERIREKINKEISKFNKNKLKDLYQYIKMFMKEEP